MAAACPAARVPPALPRQSCASPCALHASQYQARRKQAVLRRPSCGHILAPPAAQPCTRLSTASRASPRRSSHGDAHTGRIHAVRGARDGRFHGPNGACRRRRRHRWRRSHRAHLARGRHRVRGARPTALEQHWTRHARMRRRGVRRCTFSSRISCAHCLTGLRLCHAPRSRCARSGRSRSCTSCLYPFPRSGCGACSMRVLRRWSALTRATAASLIA